MSDSNNFTTIAIPFGTALVNLEKAPLKVLGKNFNTFFFFYNLFSLNENAHNFFAVWNFATLLILTLS